MKIFFDHQAFSTQNYGGVSRYFCELINGLNKKAGIEADLSLLFSNNAHLREAGLNAYPFFLNYTFSKKQEILYRINKLHNLFELRRGNYNIFHATNYDPFFIPHLKGKPFVVTFYDAIHERFGGRYKELSDVSQFISYKKLLAERANKIIAISDSTKRDLIELYSLDPNKIHVVHLGSSFRYDGDIVISNNDQVPYLLYVGKRDAYKNFPKFLSAIKDLLKKYNILLICAGGGGFTIEEQVLIRSFSLENIVVHKPINDTILRNLYVSARAFVFPSLYEGFGIPILEAFACNCPCVLSNTSSLPEVAGEAALYFDPLDEYSINQSIERIITDDTLRESLVDKGKQRLSLFSWTQTVEKTISVYESCL